jgi:hypothetical protein
MVLWPSFLAAAVETMVFFAVFDPVYLGEGTALAELIANHNARLCVGIFFFTGRFPLQHLTVYRVHGKRRLNVRIGRFHDVAR